MRLNLEEDVIWPALKGATAVIVTVTLPLWIPFWIIGKLISNNTGRWGLVGIVLGVIAGIVTRIWS